MVVIDPNLTIALIVIAVVIVVIVVIIVVKSIDSSVLTVTSRDLGLLPVSQV